MDDQMPLVRSRPTRWRRTLSLVRVSGLATLFAALFGCAAPVPRAGVGAIAGVPAGAARLWIYRDYEPYETLARPYVRINGRIAGVSEPGGAFHRDLPPGAYRVTVDTVGRDVHQFATITLAPGQTGFVKIESSKLWLSDLSYRADTFYTRLIPRGVAEKEVGGSHSMPPERLSHLPEKS
ncbi:MAG TPA: hypothetical protein VGR91_15270 [Stellaceae bacterium]|nr:hypothetical protein [Stellaceae bacterium]